MNVLKPSSSPAFHPTERRRHLRFLPGERGSYLGWWEGDQFQTETCTLQNVSAGGAALELEPGLRVPDEVWLCAIGPGLITWTAARVVSRDGRSVRLQFAGPIPYEVFELFL